MVCAQTASQTARRPRAALRRRQRPLGQKAAAFCEVCAQTTSQTSHGLRLPTGLTTFADSLPSPCLTACAALSGDKEVDLENSSERFGTGSSARADVEGDAASHIRRSSILSRRTVVVRWPLSSDSERRPSSRDVFGEVVGRISGWALLTRTPLTGVDVRGPRMMGDRKRRAQSSAGFRDGLAGREVTTVGSS